MQQQQLIVDRLPQRKLADVEFFEYCSRPTEALSGSSGDVGSRRTQHDLQLVHLERAFKISVLRYPSWT